ncbi:MAG TPA: C45 family peptidase [Verrucomicrobiae bacterium]|nr:C45 family peptidase [Verrucomicrobiae bacterium]
MTTLRKFNSYMIAGICALLALGCGTAARTLVMNNPRVEKILTEPKPDRTVTHTGRVEYVGDADNRITVLYVTGTPYEMGYEHGRLLAEQIRGTIKDVEAGADKFLPKELRNTKLVSQRAQDNIIDEILDRSWHMMARYAPHEDLEEMAGLAAGSGVALDRIHRMHAIPDVGETSCSGLVAKGNATSDGHVYQLRILDYGANFNLQRRPLITVYRPTTENANPYVTIGWVGFVGAISGVNEKGVALSEMGFGNPPGETLAGTPMPFLLKNVLRYADAAEDGAAIIRAARRTNSYVYFLGDKRNDPIGMITSAQQCLAYHANDRDTLAVNGKSMPQFHDVVYGGHYEDKQAQLVHDLQGKFDVASIQELARQIAMKSNLQTVIYDLTADKIWVANRKDKIRAADRPYVEFSLADAWNKSSQYAASTNAPQLSASTH